MKMQRRSKRLSMISEDVQRVSSYFNRHRRTLRCREDFLLGLPRRSTQRILQNRNYLFPYKIHDAHEIEERDYEARAELES